MRKNATSLLSALLTIACIAVIGATVVLLFVNGSRLVAANESSDSGASSYQLPFSSDNAALSSSHSSSLSLSSKSASSSDVSSSSSQSSSSSSSSTESSHQSSSVPPAPSEPSVQESVPVPSSEQASAPPQDPSSAASASSSAATPPTTLTYGYNQGLCYPMLDLINAARAAAGAGPLTWSSDIEQVAILRAQESAVVFSHDRPDGTPWYTISPLIFGENLAAGYGTTQEAFDAWMASPGHAENILRPSFTQIGMGYVYCENGDGGYYHYWAQEFA